MSRAARLLELLVRVQTRPRFTGRELAEEFGVSRRTILRDLAELEDMGVPLRSTPGPGGGYSLPRGGRRLSPSLTVDEALGLIVSYESFLGYAESPFDRENVSAVTKLRAALPPDVVGELDELRRHVAVLEPAREYEAPHLGELLRASVDGAHLKVHYESVSGRSERVIFPYGVFASRGFWYCACRDHVRGRRVSLRADRFISVERVEGHERPPHIPSATWADERIEDGVETLELRIRVTGRGMKSFDLTTLFRNVEPVEGGGIIHEEIPQSSMDYYARRILGFGTDVVVESPPEMVRALREKMDDVSRLYG